MEKSVFDTLAAVDVTAHTEKKGNLTYLSWVWAWGYVKHLYPDTTYRVIKNADGWDYHHDGRTARVEVEVTIAGVSQIETLPVMDSRNRSLPLDQITSFNVNTAIKRCCTKCLALFGLGLSIYAGEDLGYLDMEPAKAPAKKKAAPVEDTAGTIEDDQLLTAIDEVCRCRSRQDLNAAYRTWGAIYGEGGTHANGAFIERVKTMAAKYPKAQ